MAATAAGILALYVSPALADSDATGTAGGSPGVVSGDNVLAPVNVPVDVCGNSVDVAAALDPAFGNSCASAPASAEPTGDRAHETSYGDSGYGTETGATPPSDVCGTPPAYGEETPPAYGDNAPPGYGEQTPPCAETPPPKSTPPAETTPPSESTPPETTPPSQSTPPAETTPPSQTTPPGGPPPSLPHTGSDREAMLAASAASAALIAGGTMLYRRARAASRRS